MTSRLVMKPTLGRFPIDNPFRITNFWSSKNQSINLHIQSAPISGISCRIVEAAVLQNGEALRYASERCQANRDIVALAVENDPVALIYSALELQADAELTGT